MTLPEPPFRPLPPWELACIKVIAKCNPFLWRQRPGKATSPLYDLGIRLTSDLRKQMLLRRKVMVFTEKFKMKTKYAKMFCHP